MTLSKPSSPVFSIQTKRIWLAALLPMLFISDILYGSMQIYGMALSITPGVIIRGLVFLIAFYMILTKTYLVGKALFFWILVLSVSTLPGLLIGLEKGKDIFFEFSSLSKILYLPIVTGLFVILIRRYHIGIDDILSFIEYAAYVLGFSLLISQRSDFKRMTYGDYAFGSTGIFYAQNDLTLAFGLALLAGGYRMVMERFSWFRLLLIGLSAFACVQIGTRASLAVLAGAALTAAACAIWGRVSRRQTTIGRIKIWSVALSIFMVTIGALIYGLTKQMEFDYQQKKLEQVIEGELPRLSLISSGMQRISERAVLFNLFGEGTDSFQRGVAQHFPTSKERRMVEVDWLDIYGAHGVVFTVLIHIFVLTVLFGSTYRFVFRREPEYGVVAAATLLYLGHSSIAGHALVSPIPSTLAAAYFSIFFSAKKPRA